MRKIFSFSLIKSAFLNVFWFHWLPSQNYGGVEKSQWQIPNDQSFQREPFPKPGQGSPSSQWNGSLHSMCPWSSCRLCEMVLKNPLTRFTVIPELKPCLREHIGSCLLLSSLCLFASQEYEVKSFLTMLTNCGRGWGTGRITWLSQSQGSLSFLADFGEIW